MPHTTNRLAFVKCDQAEPFFHLYTVLVAVELALKDRLPAFTGNHDLEALMIKVVSPLPSGLRTQFTMLQASLNVLACTAPNGSRATVRAAKYPDLRYVRHEKDGFTGDATDTQISTALRNALGLISELKLAGVTL